MVTSDDRPRRQARKVKGELSGSKALPSRALEDLSKGSPAGSLASKRFLTFKYLRQPLMALQW